MLCGRQPRCGAQSRRMPGSGKNLWPERFRHPDADIGHGQIEMACLAAFSPLVQGREHATHETDGRRKVDSRNSQLHREMIRIAGQIHDARRRLHHRVESFLLAIVGREAEAADRTVDDSRVGGAQIGKAEPHQFQRAGCEVFHPHIGLRRELKHQFQATQIFRLDHDAAFAGIVNVKEIAGPADPLAGLAQAFAFARLDLDDFSTEVAKQAPGHGHAGARPEFEDWRPQRRTAAVLWRRGRRRQRPRR